MGKNKAKATVKFVGRSADNVTGSSYLVEYKGEKTLVDYGFVQVKNKLTQWRLNNENFKFKVKEIDNIVLTHFGHLDHAGGLARLYANGCKAKIFANKGAREYLRLSFKDNMKIMLKDSEILSAQNGKQFTPPYNEDDVERMLNHIVEVDYNKQIVIGEYTSIEMYSAYHISGSSQVYLKIRDGNYKRSVWFSGDLGNTKIVKPFLEEFRPVKTCDVAIVESTYAMNPRSVTQKHRDKDREKMKTVVRECCVEGKGKVIIASFSMQRLQELMYEFWLLYKDDPTFDTPIMIDTPLGINICEMFSEIIPDHDQELWYDIMSWDKFNFVMDWELSEMLVKGKKPCISIVSSGFCSGGRVIRHIQENLNNENNTFVFVGYSSPDSLASEIKTGEKRVLDVEGVKVKNDAKVVLLNSFSSHMQHEEMLSYYTSVKSKEIYLVHGEKSRQYEFAELLDSRFKEKGLTTKVFVPQMNDEIVIN